MNDLLGNVVFSHMLGKLYVFRREYLVASHDIVQIYVKDNGTIVDVEDYDTIIHQPADHRLPTADEISIVEKLISLIKE